MVRYTCAWACQWWEVSGVMVGMGLGEAVPSTGKGVGEAVPTTGMGCKCA